MDPAYLTGTQCVLRDIPESDYPELRAIENSVRLEADDDLPYPQTLDAIEKMATMKTPDHCFGIYVGHELAGSVAVFGVDFLHQHAKVGIAISPEFQHRGLGQDALSVLLNFCFAQMPLHKIKLTVFADNQPAIHCYEKLGFERAGRFKDEYFRNGQFIDLLAYDLMRDDWLAN